MTATQSPLKRRLYSSWAFRGLFAKFLWVLVPVFLLLTVPSMAFLGQFEAQNEQEELASRIGSQAARVAASLERHDVAANPLLARDLLAFLAADRSFICAELQARDGGQILAAAPPNLGCVHQNSKQRLELTVGEDDTHTLVVQFSDTEIVASRKLHRSIEFSMLGIGFVLAVVAASLGFRLIVSKPLGQLLTAIRQNSETGERTAIQVSSNDELARSLSRSMACSGAKMSAKKSLQETNEKLRVSQQEFEQLSRELEVRVDERTLELANREEAFFESEQRFRDFAKASSDWFWEMDAQVRFSYFSDRFAEVAGIDPSALLGKTREETGIPNVDPAQWQRHLDALSNRQPFRNFVHPRVKPNGETVWLSINGVPHFDQEGIFKGFRGTGNDMTELVEAHQTAEQARLESERANRAKSEFLANMSHELRTPLNAIIGYAELLQEEAQDRQDRQLFDDISKVCKSARHLHGLVNDILDLSKIEADKMDINLDHVDIPTLIADVGDAVRPLVTKQANSFHIENAAEVNTLVTDGQMLRQALLNLLGNAAKFTHAGEVRLAVDQVGQDWLRFEVSDTGIGMSEEQISQVFEPFTQGDASISKNYGGTGLGLSLCRRFAELLNGRIERGERRRRRHPVHARLANPSGGARRLHGGIRMTQKDTESPMTRILIVEDNEINRDMLGRRLARRGFDVLCAIDGATAIAMTEAEAPDLILMDIGLGEDNGLDVTRQIRARGIRAEHSDYRANGPRNGVRPGQVPRRWLQRLRDEAGRVRKTTQ